MIERIKEFIEVKGLSVSAFEQSINASDGMIRRAIKNGTDIQSKWISHISDNYPDLRLEWLITGNGPMLRTDEPPPPSEPKDSRELEMCRTLLKEKDARIEEQAKEIGRLEERLSTFQTRSRAEPSHGAVIPIHDTGGVPTVAPAMRDVPIPPQSTGDKLNPISNK